MADSSFRGRFLWHELLTSDTASAAKFFGKIVGWKTEAFPNSPFPYTLFKMDRPMAGLMSLKDAEMPPSAPPFWMSYIGTPDVDATVREAVSLGAKLEKPAADIPTVGRYAVMSDPQGAGFIAFTPLPPQGSQPRDVSARPGLGDFSWHELATTDWKAALAFYKKVFGWEETSAMDMGQDLGTYQMFGIGGVPMGGIFNKPPQLPRPSWLPYIHVKDAKKVADMVKAGGATVLNGPMEVPGGDWIVQAMDPQGGTFAVHSLKPAAAAAAAPAKPAPRKKAAPAKAAKKKAKPAKKKTAKKAAAARKTVKKKVAKATKKAGKKKAAPKTKAAKKRAGKKK